MTRYFSIEEWKEAIHSRYDCGIEYSTNDEGDITALASFKNSNLYIGKFYLKNKTGLVYDRRKNKR